MASKATTRRIDKSLAHRAEPKTALAQRVEFNTDNPIGALLNMMTTKGVTPESLEKTLAVYERMEAKRAQKECAVAFAALQAELPRVLAKKAVPNNDGTIRYAYAPYEDIAEAVAPALARHGFGVEYSFDYKDQPTRVIVTCTLTHKGGHSKTSNFAVRVGQGPPKSNEAQADGAAATYAKRRAFESILNIVVEHDSDARNLGEAIDADEAWEIEARCRKAADGDEAQVARLLAITGADSFAEIRRNKYRVLVAHLDNAEAQKPAPKVSGDVVPGPSKELIEARDALMQVVAKWGGLKDGQDVKSACRDVARRMGIPDIGHLNATGVKSLIQNIEKESKTKTFAAFLA